MNLRYIAVIFAALIIILGVLFMRRDHEQTIALPPEQINKISLYDFHEYQLHAETSDTLIIYSPDTLSQIVEILQKSKTVFVEGKGPHVVWRAKMLIYSGDRQPMLIDLAMRPPYDCWLNYAPDKSGSRTYYQNPQLCKYLRDHIRRVYGKNRVP